MPVRTPVAEVLGGSLVGGKDFDDGPGEPDHLAVFVEAVVVADGAAPGDIVETVPEAVSVLVVAGLLQALGGDVDVIVGGAEVPGEGECSRNARGSWRGLPGTWR